MHVLALVGRDECKVGHATRLQIRIEAMLAIERNDLIEAQRTIFAFLHGGEVGKGVVLDRVEIHDV